MRVTFDNAHVKDFEDGNLLGKTFEYIDKLRSGSGIGYNGYESFLNLPFDEKSILSCDYLYREKGLSKIRFLFVVGIGGSTLGPRAVYDALNGWQDNADIYRFPKVYFISNVNFDYIKILAKRLSEENVKAEDIYISVASKSGKTYEVEKNLAQLLTEFDFIEGLHSRIGVTTTEGSPLWKKAEESGWDILEVPSKVSGRFLVFSAIGIFPLRVVGVNVADFLEGAMQTIKNLEMGERSYSVISAISKYMHYKEGRDNEVNFVFGTGFKSLSEWSSSITSESLGKNGGGILPITAIGSSDLHSLGQMLFQGPKDKFTNFIYSADLDPINKKILHAVIGAYKKENLPFYEYDLTHLDEGVQISSISQNIGMNRTVNLTRCLGEFMQAKILETVLIANLMDINPFDQPGVELYKSLL